jgi:hypothetical protein
MWGWIIGAVIRQAKLLAASTGASFFHVHSLLPNLSLKARGAPLRLSTQLEGRSPGKG